MNVCSDINAMSFNASPHAGHGKTFHVESRNNNLNRDLKNDTSLDTAAEILQTQRPKRSYRMKNSHSTKMVNSN